MRARMKDCRRKSGSGDTAAVAAEAPPTGSSDVVSVIVAADESDTCASVDDVNVEDSGDDGDSGDGDAVGEEEAGLLESAAEGRAKKPACSDNGWRVLVAVVAVLVVDAVDADDFAASCCSVNASFVLPGRAGRGEGAKRDVWNMTAHAREASKCGAFVCFITRRYLRI